MNEKNLKLYNVLTTIIPFVFFVLSALSLALLVMAGFQFDLLSLNPDILKELFSDFALYLNGGLIPIPEIICFAAFTLFEVIMLIIMLINVIILFCKSFTFLKKKEYDKRKESFTKFARKSLFVLSLASFVVMMNTNLGGKPVGAKTIILIVVALMFVIAVVMDLLFEKLISETSSTWLETGLAIGKRLIGFATVFILLISVDKFRSLLNDFAVLTGPDSDNIKIIGGLISMALYLTIIIMTLKAFRKFATKGAFTQNKKSPYKNLMTSGIVILILSILLLVAYQIFNYATFVSIGQLFDDLVKLMLVPILASISAIVVSADKENSSKDSVEEKEKITVETIE